MKKYLLLVCALSCIVFAKAKDWTQYVNPLMGSQSSFELSTGNTYPAIARPWGMNFWTPQTGKMGNGWQYVYTSNKIRGFKQTHQPSPWMNDYGQFSIMPLTGKPEFDEEKRASWFSHKAEVAKPHYYKVYLSDYDVLTELKPTERAVMFRFTFPDSERSYIVVDAFDKGSYVKILPDERRIVGYTTRNTGGGPDNFKNYFVIEFDKNLADRFGKSFIHREAFPLPVAGAAQRAELADDLAAELPFPLPDAADELFAAELVAAGVLLLAQVLFDPRLGGDAGVVGAGEPADLLALHAVVAAEDVLKRVVEHVPEGENAGDVRRRDDDGIRLLLRIRFPVKIPGGFPFREPFRFDLSRFIGSRQRFLRTHFLLQTPVDAFQNTDKPHNIAHTSDFFSRGKFFREKIFVPFRRDGCI